MSTFKLFGTSNSQELTAQIAVQLEVEVGKLDSTRFSDGEVFVRFDESVRGNTVCLIAQINMPYENMFEFFATIDAARRASAKEIICVLPYLPHSRQERKDNTRSSINSRLLADFIEEAGADRVITIDMHTTSIEGFFKKPVDHLDTIHLFNQHIQSHFDQQNLCLCSPDFGGLKRIKKIQKLVGCEMVVIDKERSAANKIAAMEIIGSVAGKNVVIVDDMVDTAGTLCKAANLLREQGARSVSAYCTHGLLSGKALTRVSESALDKLYITNSVNPIPDHHKIEQISCASLLADAINNLIHNRSLKALNA